MCRVFGFRSAFPSAVHDSLVRARNALTVQSKQHPDGWGIAYFETDAPRLIRGTGAAFLDGDFARTADAVSARTVLAHVRKASVGSVRVENCHPFVRGGLAFAHNGDVARWDTIREEVEARVAPAHRHFEGDTDSERCFALFLTLLEEQTGEPARRAPFGAVRDALAETARTLCALADPGAKKPCVLNLVVARADLLCAIHHGNTLWYSTHKVRCEERDACDFLDPTCEAPARSGDRVRHLLLASEPLSTRNVWRPLAEDAVVGVDAEMRLHAPEWRPPLHPTLAGAGI